MGTVDPRTVLTRALDALVTLAPPQDGRRVAELRRRLREDRFRILVVGEAKRGKSTFINALIGLPVLPMGVTPLTAVATTVTFGRPERVAVRFRDGRCEDTVVERK